MENTVKMTLKGKTFRKWASEQNIYEFEKEINPIGHSDPVLGLYTYMYMTFTVKQVYLRFQVSVYRAIGSLISFMAKTVIFTGLALYDMVHNPIVSPNNSANTDKCLPHMRRL